MSLLYDTQALRFDKVVLSSSVRWSGRKVSSIVVPLFLPHPPCGNLRDLTGSLSAMSVLLETSYGDIVVDLLPELSPKACTNFVKLCAVKYYNDCEFFRVEKGFIAQTGDPTNEGGGGESVFAKCDPPGPAFFEQERSPFATHERKGTISMAASVLDDERRIGSQFFVTLAEGLSYLDNDHTVIGEVAEGMDVVDKIADAFVSEDFRPYRLIRIRHTIVLHDPFEDPLGLPANCPSPEPAQGGRDDRLGSDEEEEIDEYEDEEKRLRLKQEEEEREARSRAEVLEIIGDIGAADLKPPENVLFICKLNPVTEADDLEIIFSRFGECKADILRDKITGDSLCYGFVEFEDKKQCEKAYFKMDSSLIDDRRVRVDFSQSVSKLWNAARRAKASGAQPMYQSGHTSKRPRLDTAYSPSRPQGGAFAPERSEEALHAERHTLQALNKGHQTVTNVKPRRRSRFDIKPG